MGDKIFVSATANEKALFLIMNLGYFKSFFALFMQKKLFTARKVEIGHNIYHLNTLQSILHSQ